MSSEKVHCLQFTYPNFQHPSPCFFYQVTHLESTLYTTLRQTEALHTVIIFFSTQIDLTQQQIFGKFKKS